MSEEIEKYDEFEDLSLPEGKEGDSNLDEYGVWIKKRPSTNDELQSSEEKGDIMEEEEIPFDFDGPDENDSSYEDAFEKELRETENNSGEASSDSNFDDIDMSNFFTDLSNSEENEEISEKEDEEALKMDLNFETVDSYMSDENKDDFDSMLNDAESSDVELDDFLSDLNSSTASATQATFEDSSREDIELNIDVDENQDFSNIGKSSETEESIILPQPTSESTEVDIEEANKDSIIIKSTVVEPENIDEIREENRKVMGESNKEGFNDVEALANELTSDISTITNNFSAKEGGVVSVAGLDKITELLTDIVKELSSMKNEISALKTSASFTSTSASIQTKKDIDNEDEEDTGFFKDEDTDEAIALTGDELNNILITSDFIEENEQTVDEVPEDNMEVCESSSDNETEDNFSQEKDVDFDDITLENSKLDDFVIPEELDYSMLSNESEETTSTEGSDMSYLDEKDDDVSIDIPKSQDITVEEVLTTGEETQEEEENITNDKDITAEEDIEADEDITIEEDIKTDKDITIEEDVTTGEDVPLNAECSDSEALPSNIKKEVKSVLAYMDQLLESLPEDKMKEFAESEYFEMYNRLFNELGIS